MLKQAVICQHLDKSFGTTAVVRNLSFAIQTGQILVLLGPSGCGKTTTLRLIAGFEQLDSGRIEIDGQVVADGRLHLPPEKRRVGMVFQDYAIFPHMNVAQNVAFGLKRRGPQSRVEAMLEMVGLAGLDKQMPHELSGGQQQRVALARALAPDPVVLLLDEPFSNLDYSRRMQMRQEVREVLQQNEATAVFVTHDQEEALFLGDQVAVMKDGALEQIGTPMQIFHQPHTRFVAEFMGQTDFIRGEITDQGVATVMGLLPQKAVMPVGTAVSVAVRPDDVILVAEEDGNGRVLSRQFTGIASIYKVALADGTIVHSWQPHTVELSVGTAVQATFRDGHLLNCFYGDNNLITL
jgi:iron(III) transport system ATP-binding protein